MCVRIMSADGDARIELLNFFRPQEKFQLYHTIFPSLFLHKGKLDVEELCLPNSWSYK